MIKYSSYLVVHQNKEHTGTFNLHLRCEGDTGYTFS